MGRRFWPVTCILSEFCSPKSGYICLSVGSGRNVQIPVSRSNMEHNRIYLTGECIDSSLVVFRKRVDGPFA
jgi:hypothetical protein